jgi:hypothetical protein
MRARLAVLAHNPKKAAMSRGRKSAPVRKTVQGHLGDGQRDVGVPLRKWASREMHMNCLWHPIWIRVRLCDALGSGRSGGWLSRRGCR